MSGREDDRAMRDELSRSARQLIASAREGDAPTAGDRARVRRALAVAIAASAGTAGASVSTAASAKAVVASTASSTGVGAAGAGGAGAGAAGAASSSVASAVTAGLFTKVAIAVVAIGVSSGAIAAVNHYVGTSSPTTTEPAAATTAHATPGGRSSEAVARASTPAPERPSADVVPESATTASPALEIPATVGADLDGSGPPDAIGRSGRGLAPGASAPVARRARATRPATPPPEVSSHEAELRVLYAAGARGTSPEQRLISVDLHASQFRESDLAGERETARRNAVHDLCAEGPDAVAAFLRDHPASSSAPLLRQTCPDARR